MEGADLLVKEWRGSKLPGPGGSFFSLRVVDGSPLWTPCYSCDGRSVEHGEWWILQSIIDMCIYIYNYIYILYAYHIILFIIYFLFVHLFVFLHANMGLVASCKQKPARPKSSMTGIFTMVDSWQVWLYHCESDWYESRQGVPQISLLIQIQLFNSISIVPGSNIWSAAAWTSSAIAVLLVVLFLRFDPAFPFDIYAFQGTL